MVLIRVESLYILNLLNYGVTPVINQITSVLSFNQLTKSIIV